MKAFKIGDLKIKVPIIQGGMGIGVSMSGLASAVANMGGIGVISTVGIGLPFKKTKTPADYKKDSISYLRREIKKAKESSQGIIGVNVMTVLTNFTDMVKTSIEEGVDIIFSGAGLPLELPKYLKEGIRTKLVPIVSSARAANILCSKWKQNYDYLPDAFVVEGPKAGGHLGFKANQLEDAGNSLRELVKGVVEVANAMKAKYKKDIPVIAAGGIFTGKDAFEIMKHGASGVQLGTRFVATEECDASSDFKNAVVKATDEDIQIIKSPVGMPGRSLKGKFTDEAYAGKRRPSVCKHNCIKSCDPKTTTYCISEALIEASSGNLNDGFVFVGANAGKIQEISTVPEIFDELIQDYKKAEEQNHQA